MKILSIGAHFDDIELHASATLLKLQAEKGAELYSIVCTNGLLGGGAGVENRRNEQNAANELLGIKESFYLNFADVTLLHTYSLVNPIDEILMKIKPDMIFSHSENDINNDHIAVAKAAKSVNRRFMSHLYGFPASDPKVKDSMNLYVDVTKYFKKKLEILKCFTSQQYRDIFDTDFLEVQHSSFIKGRYVERFNADFMYWK